MQQKSDFSLKTHAQKLYEYMYALKLKRKDSQKSMDFELYTKDLSTLKNPKFKIIYTLKVYEFLLTKGIKPVEIVPHYLNRRWSAFKYLITRQFCEALREYDPDWYK